jgi:20S proteasome alpha/beta subunit
MAYSESLSVDRLISLAAYMLYTANKVDSLMIAGADMAVYRDTEKKFRFLDKAQISRAAKRMDKDIRKTVAGYYN